MLKKSKSIIISKEWPGLLAYTTSTFIYGDYPFEVLFSRCISYFTYVPYWNTRKNTLITTTSITRVPFFWLLLFCKSSLLSHKLRLLSMWILQGSFRPSTFIFYLTFNRATNVYLACNLKQKYVNIRFPLQIGFCCFI